MNDVKKIKLLLLVYSYPHSDLRDVESSIDFRSLLWSLLLTTVKYTWASTQCRIRTHPVSNFYERAIGLEPFSEDASPMIMGPVCAHRWIYASAKQLLERVLHAYGIEKGFNYTIIRPFNFTGPEIDYLPSEAGGGNPRVFSHFINGIANPVVSDFLLFRRL